MINSASMDNNGRLEFTRLLPAQPKTVWRFLVEEQLRGKWLCLGKLEPYEGGKIEFKFNPENFGQPRPADCDIEELSADFEGTVLQFSPPSRLAFSWPEADGAASSIVTITLTQDSEGTRLHLMHERLLRSEDQISAAAGWHAHLEQLECHLSRQLSPNFWQRHRELDINYRKELKAMQSRSVDLHQRSKIKATGHSSMKTVWKTGRGKMGFMKPLIGSWLAVDPDTPMGKVVCIRTYESVLDGKYIQLNAQWDIGDGKKTYQEKAYYGLSKDKVPTFWSFTSDGGQSTGTFADVESMHVGAKGFEANMPAGLARFGFWPTESGMVWAAEAQTKKGWKSMIHHECQRVD